ncbi:MAG: hypothetical protein V4629_02910 [Pseudomonadota bacterium]
MNPINPISSSGVAPIQQVDTHEVSVPTTLEPICSSSSTLPMTSAATTSYLVSAQQTSGFSPLMLAYDAAYEEWNGQLASQYVSRQFTANNDKTIWNRITEPDEVEKIQDQDNSNQQDNSSEQEDKENLE